MALARVARAAATCAAVALLVAAAPAAAAVSVHAKPSLTPSFGTGISDYVSRCGKDRPLRLTIDTSAGDTVAVDGGSSRSGGFTAQIALREGQSTQLVVRSHGHRTRHTVRCVPSSFPRWRFQRFGRPQAQWYVIAPSSQRAQLAADTHYVAIVDGHGVPVWWVHSDSSSPFNNTLLPDGNIAWTRWYGDPFGMRSSSAWEIHRLDGTTVTTLRTVGSPTDTHDMQPLPNGDYLLITYRLRRGVALRPYGIQSGTGNVLDGEIQELTPSGRLVWSWNSKDHIAPSETQHPVRRELPDGTTAWDVFHLNSVDLDGRGRLVISARHVNALYRIHRATGRVLWKLGGKKSPERLKVLGDPLKPTFRRQHDARVLPDGTVTVFDNRSGIGQPRAVRFRIDAKKHTARWLGQVTDPKAPESGSEGSARLLPGGDWVVSWGGSKVMSELTSSNHIVWRLKFADTVNYRTTPIPYGALKPAALRRAMDAMFPR